MYRQKTAIGDQRHFARKARTLDVAGGGEHFLHAGAAFGAFVTNDDHVAFLHLAAENAFAGGGFAIKTHGIAFKGKHFREDTCTFDDATIRSEVTAKNGQAAISAVRIIDFTNNHRVKGAHTVEKIGKGLLRQVGREVSK